MANNGESGDMPYFCIVVAMELQRGIAFKGKLPWPFLKHDFDHYTTLAYNPQTKGKKVIHIMGRLTFESTLEDYQRKATNIVISKTLRKTPQHVYAVVPNFDAALKLAFSPKLYERGDGVWVMGGESVFQHAVRSAQCRTIYLTRIFNSFNSDKTMPDFEENWTIEKDSRISNQVHNENGIKYKFEVYGRPNEH